MAFRLDGDGGLDLVANKLLEVLGDPLAAGTLLRASPGALHGVAARARAGTLSPSDIGLSGDDLRKAADAVRRGAGDPEIQAVRAAYAVLASRRERVLDALRRAGAAGPGPPGDADPGADAGLGMR